MIDDELGWRNFFSYALPPKGYDVVVAESGPDAIIKAQKEPFDLVITDIKMPEMDGVEAFATIRKIQPSVVVIMMTGHAVEDRVREGLKLKATTCLRKPFDLDSMFLTIQQALTPTSLN